MMKMMVVIKMILVMRKWAVSAKGHMTLHWHALTPPCCRLDDTSNVHHTLQCSHTKNTLCNNDKIGVVGVVGGGLGWEWGSGWGLGGHKLNTWHTATNTQLHPKIFPRRFYSLVSYASSCVCFTHLSKTGSNLHSAWTSSTPVDLATHLLTSIHWYSISLQNFNLDHHPQSGEGE